VTAAWSIALKASFNVVMKKMDMFLTWNIARVAVYV